MHGRKQSFTSLYQTFVFNFWFCASCKAKRKYTPNVSMSANQSPVQQYDNSEEENQM